jgi:hypothetical protein
MGEERRDMKRTRFYLSLSAVLGIAATIAWANQAGLPNANAQEVVPQTPVVVPDGPDQTGELRTEHRPKHHSLKASELIGMDVRGESGDDSIGSINDLMISKNGRVNYAAVSFGGFLGVGDKLFAVPLEAIDFVKTDDDAYARINVNEEQLKQMEGFDQDNWPEMADNKFLGDHALRQAERPVTDTAEGTEIDR